MKETDAEYRNRRTAEPNYAWPRVRSETIQVMVAAIEGAAAQLPLHADSKYAVKLAKSAMEQAALGDATPE